MALSAGFQQSDQRDGLEAEWHLDKIGKIVSAYLQPHSTVRSISTSLFGLSIQRAGLVQIEAMVHPRLIQ